MGPTHRDKAFSKETFLFGVPGIVLQIAIAVVLKNTYKEYQDAGQMIILTMPVLMLMVMSFLGSKALLAKNTVSLAFMFSLALLVSIYLYGFGQPIHSFWDVLSQLPGVLVIFGLLAPIARSSRSVRDSRYRKQSEKESSFLRKCESCGEEKGNCREYLFYYGLCGSTTEHQGNFVVTKTTASEIGTAKAVYCHDCATRKLRESQARMLLVLFLMVMTLVVYGMMVFANMVKFSLILAEALAFSAWFVLIGLAVIAGLKEQAGNKLAIAEKSHTIENEILDKKRKYGQSAVFWTPKRYQEFVKRAQVKMTN